MLSDAARSPKKRGVPDLEQRIKRLEAYEHWREPIRIDYPSIIGPERWVRYQSLLDAAVNHLAEAQREATELKSIIDESLARKGEQVATPAD